MKCEHSSTSAQTIQKQRAFTFVEVIAVVAVLAILAGVGIALGSRVTVATAGTGLRAHVGMLNSAVDVYVANNGDLSTVSTGAEVIEKLKTVADGASSKRINGLTGSALDRRVRGVVQTATEAASGQLRARWNSAARRFELVDSGAVGFKKFVFEEPATPVVEEVRASNLALATVGNWVWDFADSDVGVPGMREPNAGTAPTTTTPPTTLPPGVLPLDPPTFSIPGGSYDYSAFGLDLHFDDPNPVGTSQVFYSINGGPGLPYTGASVSVQPDDLVMAYAVSLDPDGWFDSVSAVETYEMNFVITGSTSGLFSDPVGGPDMVTGGWGNYFTWGTPATEQGFTDPSWLLYEGTEFFNVSEGERFLLGSLDYYNGTISGGTGADALSLSVDLVFGDGAQTQAFDYDLNLINSPNLPDGTAAESADYVQFGNIYAEVPATLGGIDYMMIIEFGETEGAGFNSVDEFFVHEGEVATGSLYGTLVRAWGDEGQQG